MATETNNTISQFIYYNGQLLQRQDRQNTSYFIMYFNIFGEFDNFEDWDAAQEKGCGRVIVRQQRALYPFCRD